MVAIVLALSAALGTLAGLFLGMPALGFVLWPLTRAVCRRINVEIDPHDEHDPVMKLEGSLAAGVGMALGVFASVALVGLGLAALASDPPVLVSHVLRAASAAGGVAGLTFGSLWRFGYERHSVAPHLLATALLAALTTTVLVW